MSNTTTITIIIQIQKSDGAATPPGLVVVAGAGFCAVASVRLKVPTGLGSLGMGATALTCQ